MIKPNFLIIGAAKAGTTSLYYYLKQHKDIGFPDLKEPKYFSSSCVNFPQQGIGDWSIDKFHVKNEEKYFKLFQKKNCYEKIGEASPDYLIYHNCTAVKIREILGDIPIIISLRNPVNRAFSAFSYLVRDGREYLSFKEALSAEEYRKNNNWDFMWRYKESGMYYEQLTTFLKMFSKVKIIIFEDFVTNPLKITNEVFNFLDLEEISELETLDHNPSGLPTNSFSKFLLNRKSKTAVLFRESLKKYVPRRFLEYIAKKSLEKQKISEEDKKFLINYFIEDIIKLENLIKKNLDDWKK